MEKAKFCNRNQNTPFEINCKYFINNQKISSLITNINSCQQHPVLLSQLLNKQLPSIIFSFDPDQLAQWHSQQQLEARIKRHALNFQEAKRQQFLGKGISHFERIDILWLHLIHGISQVQLSNKYEVHHNSIYRIVKAFQQEGRTSNHTQSGLLTQHQSKV